MACVPPALRVGLNSNAWFTEPVGCRFLCTNHTALGSLPSLSLDGFFSSRCLHAATHKYLRGFLQSIAVVVRADTH